MRPGTVIDDRFEIEHLAGSGGMGAVYRARDRTTGQPIALKAVRYAGSDVSGRFGREARILAEIVHPGIVRYVAHGTMGSGEPYLAMEWLEGESLSERLARKGLTLDEAVRVIQLVASAVSALHRSGIIHRDLKPSNLLLVDRSVEQVKLLDFGIARLVHGDRTLTTSGAMLGTAGYMAPEQARGESKVDARADVYALGCILFKCVTGRAVFDGDDPLAVLLRVVLEEPPRLRSFVEDVPDDLDDLCARMLSKMPDVRPADATAVAEELSHLGEVPGRRAAPPSALGPALTATERRILCLVLARIAPAAERPRGPGGLRTIGSTGDGGIL